MIQQDFAKLIEANGYGVLSESIFVDAWPVDPVDSVSVGGYEGDPPQRVQNTKGIKSIISRIQLQVRRSDKLQAHTDATAIMELLSRIHNELLYGRLYTDVWPLQSPFLLREDEKGNPIYSVNFRVVATP